MRKTRRSLPTNRNQRRNSIQAIQESRSLLDWRLFLLRMCLQDSPDELRVPRHVVVQCDALDPNHDRLHVVAYRRDRNRRSLSLARRLRASRSRRASRFLSESRTR